mgnify:CR=1 FL=1
MQAARSSPLTKELKAFLVSRLRLVCEASCGEVRWCVELESIRLLQLDVLTDESESSSLFLHRKFHCHLGRARGL